MINVKTNLEKIVVKFEKAEVVKEYALKDLPIGTIDYLLQGATRKFNDSVNSKARELREKGEKVDYAALIAEVEDRILTGKFNEPRQASEHAAFRNFVISQLKTVYKVPAKLFDSCKGATVRVILATAFGISDESRLEKAETLFREQYEQTQIRIDGLFD